MKAILSCPVSNFNDTSEMGFSIGKEIKSLFHFFPREAFTDCVDLFHSTYFNHSLIFILTTNTLSYKFSSKEYQTKVIQSHRILITRKSNLNKLSKRLNHSLESCVKILIHMWHSCNHRIILERIGLNSLQISGVNNCLCTKLFDTFVFSCLSSKGSDSASHSCADLDTKVA